MSEAQPSKKNAMDRRITIGAQIDAMRDFSEDENVPRADFCLAWRGK
jgi:hypothetical protein